MGRGLETRGGMDCRPVTPVTFTTGRVLRSTPVDARVPARADAAEHWCGSAWEWDVRDRVQGLRAAVWGTAGRSVGTP